MVHYKQHQSSVSLPVDSLIDDNMFYVQVCHTVHHVTIEYSPRHRLFFHVMYSRNRGAFNINLQYRLFPLHVK